MPELIYDIKFKIHSPESNINPKKLTKEIKELQGEFDNLDDSNKNLSKGLATSNQALFSFSDLVQDSAQFSQGFSQGMRAIGNNVGFTAELIGNLNRRVTDHNESLTKAEIAQGKSKTTIGELGRSFLGTGGIILGLNAVVLASQFAFEALDKKLKKLTDTGKAQADAFSEMAKAFADFDTDAPDPFGIRSRAIEIDLLKEQVGDFETQTIFLREILDNLRLAPSANLNVFEEFLRERFPLAFLKMSAATNKSAADLVILGENLEQTKKNLDASTFAQDAFQKKLDEGRPSLKNFVSLTGELEKVLLQEALGIQLTTESLESLLTATQKEIELVTQRGIQTPEEIFTANQLISLQNQLKEAIDKTNESREKEIEQLEKSFKSANDRIRSTNENIALLELELQASEATDKRAKIQAEAELERQEIITEARARALDAKQEFIDQGIDKDKAAALASVEIEAINEEAKLKVKIINAEESLKLQKLTDEESKKQESNALKDRQQARDDANAQLRATEAELQAQLLSIKGAANERIKADEIAFLLFDANLKAIAADKTLSDAEEQAAISIAFSELNIQIAKNELDEKRRIKDAEVEAERNKQKRLSEIQAQANAEFAAKEAEFNLKLFNARGEANETQIQEEVAVDRFLAEIDRINSDKKISNAEREFLARQALANQELELAKIQVNAEKLVAQQRQEAQEMAVQGVQAASALLQGLFGENKKIAIAETLVSTYFAAQKAFESQFKPLATVDSPARGAAAAAIAVAQGLARVAAIKSASAGGGGGSRGGGSRGGGGGGIGSRTRASGLFGTTDTASGNMSNNQPLFTPNASEKNRGIAIVVNNTFDDRTVASVASNGNDQRREGAVSGLSP
tara:strand:+ start:3692 stop:6289 length:2598 start_codon:yes stop_codon:yes gene_type:complete